MQKKNRFRHTALALAVVQALAGGVARAATITVNSALDDGDGGNCTLREAIGAVNAGTDQDGCSNSSGEPFGTNDTIVFDPAVNGSTVTLALGSLVPVNDVTISGPGSDLFTIDGNDVTKPFSVASLTLGLGGLTLTGGSGSGGAMNVDSANVTLTDVVVSNNTAGDGAGLLFDSSTVSMTDVTVSGNSTEGTGGGIYSLNSSTVTMTNVVISNNTAYGASSDGIGGGLYANGSTLTLTDCTVSGNSAEYGGGLYVRSYSTMTMTNCTVSGNSSTGSIGNGGGINVRSSAYANIDSSTISGNYAKNVGGGIFNDSVSSVALTNSTLSGNSTPNSGAGMFIRASSTTMVNSTVTGNSADYGGGFDLNSDATLTLVNTIVSGNTAGVVAEIRSTSATVSAGASNLLGDASENSSAIQGVSLTGTSDIIATSDYQNIPLAAILAPLADNGGPTLTHALVTGSPALGAAGPASCPPADQRGEPRDGVCDIGAFEIYAGQVCVTARTLGGGLAVFCL